MTLKLALVSSATPKATAAQRALADAYDWVEPPEADIVIALGGDGFMLQTLHQMLDVDCLKPVFGMNLGTVGFLMNDFRADDLLARVEAARRFTINPLRGDFYRSDGTHEVLHAINEISLLRETRQAAKLKIEINDREMIAEMIADGVLVATPAGSTAYNLSAHGPILPLDSALMALTPISPFRPRRWRGAILPDRYRIRFDVLEAEKRPVSAVADQKEFRDVARVCIAMDKSREFTLLFDPHHALDERIDAEQFIV